MTQRGAGNAGRLMWRNRQPLAEDQGGTRNAVFALVL